VAGEDGWAILALAVPALEPLSGFHERVAAPLKGAEEGDGCLLPGPWDARRRDARERGAALDDAAWARPRARADRVGPACPPPTRSSSRSSRGRRRGSSRSAPAPG